MTLRRPEHWTRISPLLDELLDLPPAERASRLAALQSQQPDLADELASLLQDSQRAQSHGFMEAPAGDPAAWVAPGTPDASLAGQRLGAYVLETPLGQGGGGSVWRARREDGRFEGAVAIKLLHLSLVGRAGAERFRREGQILARLAHPHIARLLDAGVTPGGQPYLVIELVEGERIDHHCDTHRLGLTARLALFDDVLAAVAHAHTHGVIHRDLKPGNILVRADGCVKLLDFGIAKLLADEADTAEATALTREGGRALTPEYAAPEQLRGEGATTATDVYALGVLLYQLLSGQHPTAPANGSAAEVMRATLDTEPPRLSRCATLTGPHAAAQRASTTDRLRKALRGDLETIVAHALRKSPAERYPTVAALADDLKRYQRHEPVLAQPDSLAYRSRKFVRRHRGGVTAGALVVLAIVAGVAGTVWQAQRAQAASVQARAERDRALAELRHAQAAQDLLSFMVSDGNDQALTTSQLLDRTQAMVEQGYAAQPELRARLLLMLGSQRVILAQQQPGRAVLALARAAAVEAHATVLTASVDCALGQLQALAGEFDQAKATLDSALLRLNQNRDANLGEITDCLSSRATLHSQAGQSEAAERDAREALRLGEQSGLRRDVQSAYLRAALASTLRMQGRRAEAVTQLRQALGELDALGRGQTAGAAVLWNNLGTALSASGQILAATEALHKALLLRRAVTHTEADPVGLANLGANQTQLGRLDLALPTLKQALAQAQAAGNALDTGFVERLLATALLQAGDAAGAQAHLAAARQHLVPLLKPQDATLAMLDLQSGRLALQRGDATEAQARFMAAQALLDRASARHLGRFRVAVDRTRAALALGDLVAAQASADQALVQAQQFSAGFDSSDFLGEARLVLAEVAAAKGQFRQAFELGRQAVGHYKASLGADAPVVAKAQAQVDRWAAQR